MSIKTPMGILVPTIQEPLYLLQPLLSVDIVPGRWIVIYDHTTDNIKHCGMVLSHVTVAEILGKHAPFFRLCDFVGTTFSQNPKATSITVRADETGLRPHLEDGSWDMRTRAYALPVDANPLDPFRLVVPYDTIQEADQDHRWLHNGYCHMQATNRQGQTGLTRAAGVYPVDEHLEQITQAAFR